MSGETLEKITYLVGDADAVLSIGSVPAKKPFSDEVMAFLDDLSKRLLGSRANRSFPDVITFAFWIRISSVRKMKEAHRSDGTRLGRGTAFHIAPSNVPVNFAYTLAAGLLMGNANIVRVPGKDFDQVTIIADAISDTLSGHPDMKPYIVLVRYGHDRDVNDELSAVADTRIIWGGDATIAEVRRSPLPPRSTEVLFADRYSLAVIDSDAYMEYDDKAAIAEGFFNDTYLTDQNACTSPKLVVWRGSRKTEAKELFWNRLHDTVLQKYSLQDIQAVNKLTSACLAAAALDNVRIIPSEDNLITRAVIGKPDDRLPDLMDNSGFFFEYDCDDVMDLKDICNNRKCQTVAVLGDRKWLMPLISEGIKGIDRIADIGHTMDFDLIWDGYDLTRALTREITV